MFNLNRIARQALYAVCAVAIGAYTIGHLTGAQGISALMEKRRQIQALDEETQRLREENKEKAEYLENLKADPDLQRKLVRERLHYIDDGAVDFKTPSEPGDAVPTDSKPNKPGNPGAKKSRH